MTAQILYDPVFPHGTPEGFTRGCSAGSCPAALSCREVTTRYRGDFAFRRLFDAGVSVADIVALEREAEAKPKPKPAPKAKVKPKVKGTGNSGRKPLISYTDLVALLAEGHTDRAIADMLGLDRKQVTSTRNNAGLERNPDRKGTRQPSIDSRLPEVAHLDDAAAAETLGRSVSYVHRRRLIVAKKLRETV